MASDASVGVRVTVWRPYTPARPLAFLPASAETLTLVGPDLQMQQEAFSWQIREDVWGGIVETDVRQHLSDRFMSEFEPILPTEKRSMSKLAPLLDELNAAIATSEWSASGQQLEDDDETAVRLNSLLAFYNQMLWIYSVFRDTPGASVSIR